MVMLWPTILVIAWAGLTLWLLRRPKPRHEGLIVGTLLLAYSSGRLRDDPEWFYPNLALILAVSTLAFAARKRG